VSAVRYRKYDSKQKPFEQDLIVENPSALPRWRVVCRRAQGSPGSLEAIVSARHEQEARELLESGTVPGIGLGWRVLSIEAAEP
jgi:hypothetical protein